MVIYSWKELYLIFLLKSSTKEKAERIYVFLATTKRDDPYGIGIYFSINSHGFMR